MELLPRIVRARRRYRVSFPESLAIFAHPSAQELPWSAFRVLEIQGRCFGTLLRWALMIMTLLNPAHATLSFFFFSRLPARMALASFVFRLLLAQDGCSVQPYS